MNRSALIVAAALVAGAVGCEEEQPTTQNDEATAQPDAGTEGPAGLDPELKSALSEGAATATAASPTDGPPPNGIFQAGGADEAHPPGEPPNVEVIETGSEPRVALRPKGLSGDEKLRLVITQSMRGRGAMPIAYTLGLAPKKEGEGAEDDGETPTGGPEPLVVTLEKVGVKEEHAGKVPEDQKKLLAKAEGSELTTTILPSGALGPVETTYAEGVEGAARQLVDNVGDSLGLFFSPFPDEPVGEGGYWIASDRSEVMSLELVRYRVTRVKEIDDDRVVLKLELRQYLAGGDISALVGGQQQQDIIASAFASTGEGEWTRGRDALVPESGKIEAPIVLRVSPKSNPQRGQRVELASTLELSTLEKDEGEN